MSLPIVEIGTGDADEGSPDGSISLILRKQKIREERGWFEDGKVGAAAYCSERVREGGGAMPAALRQGEKRRIRGGEDYQQILFISGARAAQTRCVDLTRIVIV